MTDFETERLGGYEDAAAEAERANERRHAARQQVERAFAVLDAAATAEAKQVFVQADEAGTCTCGHLPVDHGIGRRLDSTACIQQGCPCTHYSAVMIPEVERQRMDTHVRHGGSPVLTTTNTTNTPLDAGPTSAMPSPCRAFRPKPGMAGATLGRTLCGRCDQMYSDHPPALEVRERTLRQPSPSTRFMATLVRLAPPGERAETLGFGTKIEDDTKMVAFKVDATRAADLQSELVIDRRQNGVGLNVWVNEDDFVALPQGAETALPAQMATTIGVTGAKPTLIEGQDVIVLRTYGGERAGEALVMADVLYDPTDPRAADCQWPLGTKITDVNTNEVLLRALDWVS